MSSGEPEPRPAQAPPAPASQGAQGVLGSEILIARAQEDDRSALDELVARYLPDIRAFVRLNVDGRLRARESCSDLVQSVCIDVLRGLPRFEYRGESSFRRWLYVAVLDKVRMHERALLAAKRDVRREVTANAADDSGADDPLQRAYGTLCTPSREAIAREQLGRVEQAFESLPDDYRRVITLSRIVGLSHAEIAEVLGRTPGAVKTLLNRAVVRLTSLL